MDSPYSDRYWRFLVELKGHCFYIAKYLEKSEAHDNTIKIILAITSSSSIAGWALWTHLGFVWAFLITASQVINAIKPFLPFEKRIRTLRSLCYAYDELYLDVERDWFKIEEGLLTEEEINTATHDFKRSKFVLFKKILDEPPLPHKENLHKSAEELTESYFNQHYKS